MSLDISVYCKELTDDLMPKIVKRLNDYDMIVEVHPDVMFTNQTGFCPFKFQLTNPPAEILRGKVLVSGFELYVDDFDLAIAKEELKPKLGFWDKLLGKKQPEIAFATPDIETRLKDCRKVVSFVWHMGDSFELRFVSMVSAILTELTNGVCTYPADDIWYENKNIVEEFYKEVCDYEKSLSEKELEFHEFDGW
ncbi:MAG: hypothetical protein ACK5N4_22380 [Parabacteroides gordonii]|uniref:hypothetical protein n=1 Tax=Parabacteroides gordonii TaxID=574930 RepID=UPI003A8443DD